MASSTGTPRDSSISSSSSATAGGRNKQFLNGLRSKPSKTDKDLPARLESASPAALSHDRLLFLVANFVGFPVTLTTLTGLSYSGIFSGASLETDTHFVLKMAKKSSEEAYAGYGDDHVVQVGRDDIADLHVTGVTFDKSLSRAANGSAFRTDADISGNKTLKERELVAWQPAEGDVDNSLSMAANGETQWDQFEANERLYGITTTYDENLYTTQVDRSAPSYKDRAAAAERKAREIEGQTGGSFQVREDANDANEEERFSGVQRDQQPLANTGHKYTLPARRAPTGQPTVPGAPFDPAIISSQLARPDSRSKTPLSNTAAAASTASADAKKENIPANNRPARDLTPNRSAVPPAPSKSPNATETVERDVLKSFKDFSAGEKMRVQEQQRKQQRRDKEVKLNDLKKFAENFRLPRAVPEDMLGILAKDKTKQEEILKRSMVAAEAKKSPPEPAAAATAAAVAAEAPATTSASQTPASNIPSKPSSSSSAAKTDGVTPSTIPVEPANQRGRGNGSRGGPGGRGDKFNGSGRGGPPSTFGQRKMREYGPGSSYGGMPPMGPNMPAFPAQPAQTDIPGSRSSHAPTPSSVSSSRLNVAANEFKPNPTASTFSPSGGPSSATSHSTSRPATKAQSPTKRSFFEGQRPKPASERRSMRAGFNPLERMRAEEESKGKSAFAEIQKRNDGIPQAYRTHPTWDTTVENSEMSYHDVFEKTLGVGPFVGSFPHQHQLPPHLQQGHSYQGQAANNRFAPSPMHHGQRDHYFEDNRMQFSQSQQGMYGSPRTQPGMMMQQSPMPSQVQPVYGMPQPAMYMPGQPVPMMNYNQRPGSMPPQMMNGPGMAMPGQPFMIPGQAMYSPAAAAGQAYPVGGPQTPGGYPSPRPPPMMAHQGSQQGHAPQMMYSSTSQQGYYMPPGQPVNQMRGGGYPMQQQGSYGASPHLHYQHPASSGGGRGPQQYGQFAPQQHMPNMQQTPQAAGSDMK